MLKKILSILIVSLLIVATSGVSVYKHYSGKKLFSTSIILKAKSCCEIPCPGCKDVSKHYQLKTDFLASVFTFVKAQIIDLFQPAICLRQIDPSVLLSCHCIFLSDKSPPSTSVDLTVIQVFLI